MSYIQLTGKETELGQDIEVTGECCGGIDILLHEGKVHIDTGDVHLLRKRLFELLET